MQQQQPILWSCPSRPPPGGVSALRTTCRDANLCNRLCRMLTNRCEICREIYASCQAGLPRNERPVTPQACFSQARLLPFACENSKGRTDLVTPQHGSRALHRSFLWRPTALGRLWKQSPAVAFRALPWAARSAAHSCRTEKAGEPPGEIRKASVALDFGALLIVVGRGLQRVKSHCP